MTEQIDLRYPIGKGMEQPFSKDGYNKNVKAEYLLEIQRCPVLLENSIANLDEEQLNFPYRDGGWTPNQIIHHVADSHMNGYIRYKLVLTEDNPIIKTYNEASWAELSDTENVSVDVSLNLLYALHVRWHDLMKNMNEEDWQKTLYHPEYKRKMTLWDLLKTYAWHGKHHAAHITTLRQRNGW